MAMIVHSEFQSCLSVEFNEESTQALATLLHASVAKPGLNENSFHNVGVNWQKFSAVRVFHEQNTHVGGETRADLVSAERATRVHRSDDLNSFEAHEVQVVVVEAFVANDLLQERYQLDGVVLIRFRQVDIFQVNDQTSTLFGTVDSALRVSRLSTHLVKFLNDMESRSLCITVNDGALRRLQLLNR